MKNDIVCKLTPFVVSFLPTPKLISLISKVETTTTTTTMICMENVSNKEIILSNFTKRNNSKEETGKEENEDFDTVIIHVLTHILKVPLNHAIVQALWEDAIFEYLDFKNQGKNNINWISDLKSISKQDTVALRAVKSYAIYLSVNGGNIKVTDQTQ